MTIRNRLTYLSSVTFGIVFTVSAFVVYYTFHVVSERIIFSELQKAGLLSAMFYLDEDELSVREHKRIKGDFESEMQQTDVKVYDGSDNLRYGNGQTGEQVAPATLQRVRTAGRLRFKAGEYYGYGLHYPDNQGDFVVVVTTSNSFFISQGNQLLLVMGLALGIGLVIIFLLSFWLSRTAYQPISSVIHQVNQLQADNFEKALTMPVAKDELYDLINTFNGLLFRLSDSFVIQRNFINYVSHEFKTPLASIKGHLEVFGQKDRSPAEYQEVTAKMLRQLGDLENMVNNLMLLAGLRPNPQTNVTYRVDELLWETLELIFDRWSRARSLIHVAITVRNPGLLTTKGNGSQMKIALYNLMENAVKYTPEGRVTVELSEADSGVRLVIQDQGKGISPEELSLVHQPFFRGSNVGATKGSGIGLSLAVLICKQNNVSFSLQSEVACGTTATLGFNQL